MVLQNNTKYYCRHCIHSCKPPPVKYLILIPSTVILTIDVFIRKCSGTNTRVTSIEVQQHNKFKTMKISIIDQMKFNVKIKLYNKQFKTTNTFRPYFKIRLGASIKNVGRLVGLPA